MEGQVYSNPYTGQDFFGFLATFLSRIAGFVTGSNTSLDLASDEVQLIVLFGVATSAALLGTFLVLRKMTMLANSLSHTILLGIVITFILTNRLGEGGSHNHFNIELLLFSAFLMGVVTTFLTEFLTKTVKLQADASIGIVFTSLFALGIVSVTLLTRDVHIGTEAVMGNVDALQLTDAKLVYIVFVINIVTLLLFYKEFKITTFDAALSQALGISTGKFNYLLMILVSGTVVGAFRAVGVLMVLAFIITPPLTARLLTHRLSVMLVLSVLIGCFSSLIGVALSRHLLSVEGMALSTAGLVVTVMSAIYLFVILIMKVLIHKFLPERVSPRIT